MKRLMAMMMLAVLTVPMFGQASKKAAPKKAAAPAVTTEDVKALRDALAAQQQQIEELRQELKQRDSQFQAAQQRFDQATAAANDASSKAAAAQTLADEQKESYTKLASDVKDMQGNMTTTALQAQDDQKRLSAAEGLISRFRFTGDIRIRQEDFFQSYDGCPSNGASCNPRIRERFRARFGVEGKPGEDFAAGFFLASGFQLDPTSTNQTLTDAFERKTLAVDRAYVAYNPSRFKALSLIGGKWSYTWIRTEQTFDDDINPEGFSERLSFDLKSPIVRNVTFTGMQLLLNEANRPSGSGNCVITSSGTVCINGSSPTGGDAFAAGGQMSAKLQLAKRWTMTPSYTILNWRNVNFLLNATGTVTGGSGATIGVFAPNGMTNATVNAGAPIGGVQAKQFWSGYLYSDLILDNNINTKWANWPVRVTLEYLDNLNAQAHPLTATGAVATDLGSQSHMYFAAITFGQTKNKGNFQVGYYWLRQEQDSALASFVSSDQRAPTNILQNRFQAQYQAKSNVTLASTFWYGRTLNTGLQNALMAPGKTAGQTDPYLTRLQFDVMYKF
jgi:hypothetical protein